MHRIAFKIFYTLPFRFESNKKCIKLNYTAKESHQCRNDALIKIITFFVIENKTNRNYLVFIAPSLQ